MMPSVFISEMPAQDESLFKELIRRVSSDTQVRRDEPLARRTTLRVGGPADFYVEPASETDLAMVLTLCTERSIPFFVLGRGSNLLVRDGGYRGLVFSLSHPSFSRIVSGGERIVCGAGARLKHVAIEARRCGLAGLEFLEGIPGSVGGALRMNAGAMAAATFEIVERVRLMNYDGSIRELTPNEMEVDYRNCATLKHSIAMSAVMRGSADSPESIGQRMLAFSQKRWSSQPAAPSAGCMFKNPAAIPAGKLIDELGLKGMQVGGARVSIEHGNFLVNDGTATAKDVLELIETLKQRVKSERGIELHTEVEIVGEDC
jgi:UDP-N-acetylenolpyruvoylglucosamine reductase